MSIPSQPQPFTNTEMVNICKIIDTDGSEVQQLKSVIAYVKQSHEKPSVSITRIDRTLQSNITEENKQQLVKIKDCLQRYTSQFSAEIDPLSTHQDAVHQSATTQPNSTTNKSSTATSYATDTASTSASTAAEPVHGMNPLHSYHSYLPIDPTDSASSANPATPASPASPATPASPASPASPVDPVDSFEENPLEDLLCELQDYAETLNPEVIKEKYLPFSAGIHRFRTVACRLGTNISTSLHANRIEISEKRLGIACQYPRPSHLEAHVEMLFKNTATLLCVLSSELEISNSQLDAQQNPAKQDDMMPRYFSSSGQYGGYQTKSELKRQFSLGFGINCILYHYSIRETRSQLVKVIPTFHVQNWPDHGTIHTQALINLVSEINLIHATMKDGYEEKSSEAYNDPNSLLPVIHCLAGVGRTGTLLAAIAMKNIPEEISLCEIILDMRESRNQLMVQTEEQIKLLVSVCKDTGRALIE